MKKWQNMEVGDTTIIAHAFAEIDKAVDELKEMLDSEFEPNDAMGKIKRKWQVPYNVQIKYFKKKFKKSPLDWMKP